MTSLWDAVPFCVDHVVADRGCRKRISRRHGMDAVAVATTAGQGTTFPAEGLSRGLQVPKDALE